MLAVEERGMAAGGGAGLAGLPSRRRVVADEPSEEVVFELQEQFADVVQESGPPDGKAGVVCPILAGLFGGVAFPREGGIRQRSLGLPRPPRLSRHEKELCPARGFPPVVGDVQGQHSSGLFPAGQEKILADSFLTGGR